ncbi:copper chaperone for superoxide dismutase isoform X1 [Bos javanicus]|uniref:copper chaperone for superoxide dismutase isoform X1 n=1 Tax=Bos javanicus TaxID=9906 RepID=UPI002AA8CE00|nr:copper chaperone for superoxide dismutase isoform X1 [Bos javanicus]
MASDSEDRGTACTLEFAVQMTCQSCVDAVRTSLQGIAGIQSVEVQLENQMVLVQTTLPSQEVQALLEGTGRQAVLKGMGSGLLQNLGAAVAILGGPGPVQGVVRFLQLTPECCLIEGTIDGLQPGLHGLHVHQFGDLTRNCNSCGDHFNPDGMSHGGPQDSERHLGDLGNVRADEDGRAVFRIEDEQLKVWDVIGRSLVIDEGEDDLGRGGHPLSRITGNSGERTPSRSAPVMASPSGRSGAGPSLARDGRSLPSPLPTSERSLRLGSVTVLPAEHRPLPGGGPAHPVLGEPVCRLCLISKGCLLFPWQIKVLFSRGTLRFVCVPSSLNGLSKHSPSASVLPVEGHLLAL